MKRFWLVLVLGITASAYGGLGEFAAQWLGPGSYDVDQDGIVTFIDYAAVADSLIGSTNQRVVPNVVGMMELTATATITDAGLVVGTVGQQYDNNVPADNVISQTPVGGTIVDAGSFIDIVVAIQDEVNVPPGYFVDPAMPNNNGDGLSRTTAKKTIAAAIAAASDGNNIYLLAGTYDQTTQGESWTIDVAAKNLTIKPDPATRPAITLSTNASSFIRFMNDRTGRKYTFEDIDFNGVGSYYLIWAGAGIGGELELTRCVFLTDKMLLTATNVPYSWVIRKVAFNQCSYTSTILSPIVADGFNSFIVDGGTWVSNCGSDLTRFFSLRGNLGTVKIKNINYTVKAHAIYFSEIDIASIGDLEISSNIITQNGNWTTNYGVLLDDVEIDQSCVISGNTLRYEGYGEYQGIRLGYDSHTIAGPVISNNIITTTVYDKGDAIHCHGNVSNVTCYGNRIKGFLYGVYTEAPYSTVSYNIIESVNPMARWGSGYSTVTHNTMIAHWNSKDGGRAIVFGRINKSTDALKSPDNIFTDTSFTENASFNIDPFWAANYGSNRVGIPCHQNPFKANDWIIISGTHNYDGTYKVQSGTTSDWVVISKTFSWEVFNGSEKINVKWDLSKARADGDMIAICYSSRTSVSPNAEYYGVVTGVDELNSRITVDKWIRCSDQNVETPDVNKNVTVALWSEHNTVRNNIFDGAAANYTITYDFNPRSGDCDVNYNCYRNGMQGLSNLGSTGIPNLDALRNKWLTWPTEFETYRLNDQNSIEADPQYADPLNGDFRPTNPAVINGGEPDSNGNPQFMGALAPPPQGGS